MLHETLLPSKLRCSPHPFRHLSWRWTRWWRASPANVGAPGNGVELEVIDLHLTGLGIDLEIVDTLDWIDAGAELSDIPAPRDLITVMEDVQSSEAGNRWRVNQ